MLAFPVGIDLPERYMDTVANHFLVELTYGFALQYAGGIAGGFEPYGFGSKYEQFALDEIVELGTCKGIDICT